jgi:O-antigen ligase
MTLDSTLWFGPRNAGLGQRAAQVVGLLGVIVLCGGFALGTGLVNTGLGLLLVALLMRLPELWPTLRREPFFWLVAVLIAYLALESLWLSRSYGSAAVDAGRGFTHLLAISGLTTLAVAAGLAGDFRRVALALLLTVASLLVAIALHTGPGDLRSYLAGARATFGLSNNGPGVYMSVAVIGLVCLGPYAVARLPRQLHLVRWGAWGLLIAVTAVLLIAVVLNQSRSSWLAAVIVLPIVLLLLVRRWLRALTPRLRRRILGTAVIVGLPMLAFVGYLGADIVQQRLADERDTIATITRLELDQLKPTSIGTRVYLWRAASEFAAQRPLLGWGPGTARMLIEQIPQIHSYPHFHNLYLQLLVETGVAGLALVAAVIVALVQAARRSRQADLLPWEMGLFLAGSGAFFLIASLAQIRHDDSHGMAFIAIVTGLAYTRWLHRRIA